MWDLIVSVPDHCLSFYFTLGPDVILNTKIHKKFGLHNGFLCKPISVYAS